jgi:hypothetical protein
MMHQKRMDALWRLAGDTALGDGQLVRAALGLGAALLVPGQPFGARFGRVRGPQLWIEAANDERLAAGRTIQQGAVTADARHAEAIARLVTLHWNDGGTGALIVTPFNAGNALYVLSFWSPEAARRPLTADDDAFAESIARLIASRVQTKWDAVTERDPLEVVTLGGAAS